MTDMLFSSETNVAKGRKRKFESTLARDCVVRSAGVTLGFWGSCMGCCIKGTGRVLLRSFFKFLQGEAVMEKENSY